MPARDRPDGVALTNTHGCNGWLVVGAAGLHASGHSLGIGCALPI
jgi:hypothetical protein